MNLLKPVFVWIFVFPLVTMLPILIVTGLTKGGFVPVNITAQFVAWTVTGALVGGTLHMKKKKRIS